MQQNSASRAQRRAKERAAIHARMEDMKPSIQGKLPRRRRRRGLQATRNLRPLWDDSVAGKVLPPSRRDLATPTTMRTKKSTSNRIPNRPNSRIRTIDLIDRCDGSPTCTRQVRSIICERPSVEGTSHCLTKNAATSPVDASCAPNGIGKPLLTIAVAKLQDREAEALDKLEKHLIELETLEDMIRMHVADDGMSILGPEYCSSGDTCVCGSLTEDVEQDLPTTDTDDGRSVHSLVEPTSKDASEIPAPLNISLEGTAEAKLIRSSRANQYRRRRIIEEPFERTGLPAHIVIERAVESIIDDEIQLLAHELALSPLARG